MLDSKKNTFINLSIFLSFNFYEKSMYIENKNAFSCYLLNLSVYTRLFNIESNKTHLDLFGGLF